MGKSLYGIPSSNSLIVDDAKEESLAVVDAGTNQEINVYGGSVILELPKVLDDAKEEQQIDVRNVENDESLEVVDAGTNQEINVYAGSITPELPKVLDNEQINVYAPVAGENFPGLAFFNKSHFSIAVNGLVSLLKGGIERIEKIKAEGLVETWAIYLTDGRVEYFTITNGMVGAPGPVGPEGPIGPKGDGLEIKKVYHSIDEMNADFYGEDVPLGGMVIISTDDVNNPDNSKIFVKDEMSYRYVNDLSGSQGIQGPPGYTPKRGVDYFTEDDKIDIVKKVIDAIPWAEGVSV